MEPKNDIDQSDEIMLPGFRFHPTDEELVTFYLRRKVQQKPLSIELIKQLDIYKYDPWDLPKMATIGEKEWYFYCPRDRKYRNSARPNRVTTAGFWKATGTDRPIYSSDGTKCIGLKKSLVFYKGRAAKGTKTDWMMHEFRLPTLADCKKPLDKNMPTNDAWAICRIFKKNTIAQRVLSQAWIPPAVERRAESTSPMNSDMLSDNCVGANAAAAAAANFVNDHEDLSTETRNQTSTSSNLSSVNQGSGGSNHDFQQPSSAEIPLQAFFTAGLQDSYDKVECGSSASVSAYYAMKSMSLPNLEIPSSIYYSHVDPLSLKGTIDLVSCMLQMSPIPEFAGRPPTSDITSSFSFINSNPRTSHPSFPCLQSDGNRHSPRLASDINPLPIPSHFYDGLKSNVAWDSPSSTVDFSATHTSN